MNEVALEGLKVLDLSWVISGPLTTRWLALHGATVIRVESASKMDVVRTLPPFVGGKPSPNRAGMYNYYNTDKLGIQLNLGTNAGRQVCKELVQWSDVVFESFAPGTLDRWGLSYEDLEQVKKDVILVSISMQGQTGPYARMAGFGIELQAVSGVSNFLRWPDQMPGIMAIAYTDFISPYFAIINLMAALEQRRRTGNGQHIDVSHLESSLPFLEPEMMNYLNNGELAAPRGNHSPTAAPHAVYRCRGQDDWCAVAIIDDEQWRSFRKALDSPVWAAEPRFDTLPGRKADEVELDRLIAAWTCNLRRQEVVARLQAFGIPAGMVADGRDLHEDPQLQHRAHFQPLSHPEAGTLRYAMPSWRMSRTPARMKRHAPCLGEHTEYVCTKILGKPDQEFLRLMQEGAFE